MGEKKTRRRLDKEKKIRLQIVIFEVPETSIQFLESSIEHPASI
tara:strand:+ start:704 stop:835 length:132 start_codon:yes stop_codon:yes gene_type:complete